MSKDDKNLNPNQKQAIAALVSQKNIKTAALSIGVSPRTLQRWLTDPLFIDNLKQAENKLIDAGVHQLLLLQNKAIRTLEQLLDSKSDWVRRQAAIGILTHLVRLRELYKIEEQLDELEEIINGS